MSGTAGRRGGRGRRETARARDGAARRSRVKGWRHLLRTGLGGLAWRADSLPARRWVRYLVVTRDLSVSWVYLLPLLGLYEWAIQASGYPFRNAAEVTLKGLVDRAGHWAIWFHRIFLLGSLGAAIDVGRRRLPWLRFYPLFVFESLFWALLLGPVVSAVTGWVGLREVGPLIGAVLETGGPGRSALGATLLSVGAGIYEEVIFRLLLVGGGYLLLRRGLGLGDLVALLVAALVSSLLFAGYHHWGPYAEPFTAQAFAFRALAGAVLAGIFTVRGFALCVYVHAFYDALLEWHLPW